MGHSQAIITDLKFWDQLNSIFNAKRIIFHAGELITVEQRDYFLQSSDKNNVFLMSNIFGMISDLATVFPEPEPYTKLMSILWLEDRYYRGKGDPLLMMMSIKELQIRIQLEEQNFSHGRSRETKKGKFVVYVIRVWFQVVRGVDNVFCLN